MTRKKNKACADAIATSASSLPFTFLKRSPRQFEGIESLIEDGRRNAVVDIVKDWHPGDIADLLEWLPFATAKSLFGWLPLNTAGKCLAQVRPAFMTSLLSEIPPPRAVELIDVLESDDATDVVAHLPPTLAREVIRELKDQIEVVELLTYDSDTAGGIMSTRYVAVPVNATVEQATEQVRAHADILEEIFAVFVVDDDRHLLGVVDLKTLLLSAADTRLSEIMNSEVVSVGAAVDQEQAAHLMERYDLVALPVVDANNRLIGCITIDDAVDVLQQEAEEDISRISGAPIREVPNQPLFHAAVGRIPWLLAGLVGAALSGLVVGSFERTLRQAVILASFIPVVMAMAGNAGIQSAAVAVQAMASGTMWSGDLGRRIVRELIVALLNGIAMALVLGGFILIISQIVAIPAPGSLALTAALSLIVVIFLAGSIGAVTPILLNRWGIDPALATGPVITTSNDILGVSVFFLLATALYTGI